VPKPRSSSPPLCDFVPWTPERTTAVRERRERLWAEAAAPPPPKAPRAPSATSRKPKVFVPPPALLALPPEIRDKLIAELSK